jgi:Uri superfamily endonuclease
MGLYQLVIRLQKGRILRVGNLGRLSFPPGYYVYTGSAKRGLEARIARHLRKRKKMRWHIDYLLRVGRIVEVKRYDGGELSECELNARVEELPGSRVVAPHFGSSDCRCATHLLYFTRNPGEKLGGPRTGPFSREGVNPVR